MRINAVIILLASFAHACANESSANHAVNMQDKMAGSKLAKTLLDAMTHKLFVRALNMSSVRCAEMTDTTLAKPGHLQVATSHLCSFSAFPSPQSRSCQLPLFAQKGTGHVQSDGKIGQGLSPQELWNQKVLQLLEQAKKAAQIVAPAQVVVAGNIQRGHLPSSYAVATVADAAQVFDEFSSFLQDQQVKTINILEEMDGSGAKFSKDPWGIFTEAGSTAKSGGITRVLQGGSVIEKGACSFTMIREGVLSSERANAIRARQSKGKTHLEVKAGDTYSAAALSMVLHSRSPFVPTMRSDVRIILVSNGSASVAWFGGGADLTPSYLYEEDIKGFHQLYRDLINSHDLGQKFTYSSMKKTCDDYFYLPARSEHLGTGGIFFDNLEAFPVNPEALQFVKSVAELWMPSWLPIVEKRRSLEYTAEQRHWQMLRRGRYIEFNLLYGRAIKFGLANTHPVEAVMVSAPPAVAFDYNHKVQEGSPEEAITQVLKHPRDWA